jgi:hypothetical protein
MSAPEGGQRAVKRGEIGLQTDFAGLKSPPSEIECINSRCGGCCADLPWWRIRIMCSRSTRVAMFLDCSTPLMRHLHEPMETLMAFGRMVHGPRSSWLNRA